MRLRQLKQGYELAAIVLLNTVMLVILLNVLLGAFYLGKAVILPLASAEAAGSGQFREDGAPLETVNRTLTQMDWFDFTAYEGIDPQYASEVLDDFYDLEQLGFVYQSWVQFSEPPYDGHRMHVDFDEWGFPIRRTINDYSQGQSQVLRIFAFGGSTTFGYNVSDEHTWPSFLSRILNERAEAEGRPYRIEVINYGRGYYYPGQETVLLGGLLRNGHRPSLAIFMDGVNWGGIRDQPHFKPQVASAFMATQHGSAITVADFFSQFQWVPMVRFAGSTNRWLHARFGSARKTKDKDEDVLSSEEWQKRVEVAVNGFDQSKKMAQAICDIYGCRTLSFLQPNAHYQYNLELYRRELPDAFTSRLAPTASLYEQLRQTPTYIDLSQLFKLWGVDRKAIVDDLHYSPGFNEFLAEHVAAYIDLDDLPVFAEVIDESAATGIMRSVWTKQGRLVPGRKGAE